MFWFAFHLSFFFIALCMFLFILLGRIYAIKTTRFYCKNNRTTTLTTYLQIKDHVVTRMHVSIECLST